MSQANAKAVELDGEELATLERLLGKLSGRGTRLPWPLFRFITEIAATPNVDLVVRDAGQVLLAWRDDPFGTGWHVPGSIIRHREEIAHRIAATAEEEFGCALDVAPGPSAVIEIFDDRGHSVSLCFTATLRGEPSRRLVEAGEQPEPGDLRWFGTTPADLYPSHRIYADILPVLLADRDAAGIPVFTQHVGRRDARVTSAEGGIASDLPLT